MKSNPAVAIDAHALETLRYIRTSMEAANVVCLPGSSGFALGAVGSGAAALSFVPALHAHWFALWICAAIPAFCIASAFVLRVPPQQKLGLTPVPVRRFAVCLLPGLFAGAAMTCVLWSQGLMDPVRGVWLLSYGCALISASILTSSLLARIGTVFVCLGLIALISNDLVQSVLMGIGFGGLHLLFAVRIRQETKRAGEA